MDVELLAVVLPHCPQPVQLLLPKGHELLADAVPPPLAAAVLLAELVAETVFTESALFMAVSNSDSVNEPELSVSKLL